MTILDGFTSRRRASVLISFLIIVTAAALYTGLLIHRLTDAPNGADGYQNLRAAYNLAYHGIFSTEFGPKPTNYREPLPVAGLALYIKMDPRLSSGQTSTSINRGSAVLAVKQHNLFWAFLCLVGVGAIVLSSMRPAWVAVIAAVVAVSLTYWLLLQRNEIINRTYTEVQAATLLVWFSFALIRALETKKGSWFAAAGILLGALALTKAAFLYVGIGLIAAIALAYGISPPPPWRRLRAFALIGVMSASMAVVVLPWMARNLFQFGSFQITERGGVVLMIRAYYNKMNDTEYRGAFYHFARGKLRERVGPYLGYAPRDLEAGGRLQRLNRDGSASFAASDLRAEKAGRPEDAISFYRAARAERTRLTKFLIEQGVEHPRNRADAELQRQALSQIIANPLQHLRTSILFMWQGLPKLGNTLFTGLALLSLFTMAATGLLRRNAIMLGVSLLPAGAFVFYALASHFPTRLSAPLVPNFILALILAVAWVGVSLIAMARGRQRGTIHGKMMPSSEVAVR